ncbi:hypothetical protein LCGC14_1749290 [marine sediment metagenome]|uniref:VUT family protein n=1 Tax=marine sediment metagenome TaxID=412755 RepID=A0A0F9HRS0_9ZZZZ|nr:MAG: hypothetical protein Lokiarch_53670 [Candidatus Lokiarchaeum sp. GC14_75]
MINNKNFWTKYVVNNTLTLTLDSFLFVSFVFEGLLPLWPIIWGQILTKWFFGIIDTPFMYLSRGIITEKINLFGNLFGRKTNE